MTPVATGGNTSSGWLGRRISQPILPHSPHDLPTFFTPERVHASEPIHTLERVPSRDGAWCQNVRNHASDFHESRRLMNQLKALGVRIQRRGDRLRLSPAVALSPALLEQLKSHKRELLLLMQKQHD